MARRHTVPWYWYPDYESCGYVKPTEDFISMACVAAGDPPHLPWNAPNSPAKWHEPFIEFMKSYDLVSVLDHGEAGCWMKPDNILQQDFLTLPLGGEACEATTCSSEDDPHGVIAFLQIYGGLREDVFPSCGYFSAASNCIAGRNKLSDELKANLAASQGWLESSVVFTSGSSSILLVNNDGKFGWLVAGESQVRMAYDELAGVLDDFIRCHTGLIPRKRWFDAF